MVERKDNRITKLALLGIGTMFSSMVLSGLFLGYWVDVWLDTQPIFMLIFAVLGFIGGSLKALKLLA